MNITIKTPSFKKPTKKQLFISGGVILGSAAVIGGIALRNPQLIIKGATAVKAAAMNPAVQKAAIKTAADAGITYATGVGAFAFTTAILEAPGNKGKGFVKKTAKSFAHGALEGAKSKPIIAMSVAGGIYHFAPRTAVGIEFGTLTYVMWDLFRTVKRVATARALLEASKDTASGIRVISGLVNTWEKYIQDAIVGLGESEFSPEFVSAKDIHKMTSDDMTKIVGYYVDKHVSHNRKAASLYGEVQKDFAFLGDDGKEFIDEFSKRLGVALEIKRAAKKAA